MKITIVGTGNVGEALGRGWARKGHEVVFGSREPDSDKVRALLAETEGARSMPVSEAIAEGELVVLATPWGATEEIIRSGGDWTGKVVVDCTNPLKSDLSGLADTGDGSGGELVAGWAGGARVVKAFNTTGANNMADSSYGEQPIAMFFCGDDAEAKSVVAGLARDLGFDPVDTGGLATSAYLEALAMLWIGLAYVQGRGTEIALQLVGR